MRWSTNWVLLIPALWWVQSHAVILWRWGPLDQQSYLLQYRCQTVILGTICWYSFLWGLVVRPSPSKAEIELLIHTTKETKHHIVGWMQENRTGGDFLAHNELLSLFTAHLSCWREQSIGGCDNTNDSIISHKNILHYSEECFDEMTKQERNDFCVDCRCHCSQPVPLGQNVQYLGVQIIVECRLWRWFIFQCNKRLASPSDCRLHLGQCNIWWWQRRP